MAQLLSYQIGKEVSLNELSKNLQIDVKTVASYLNILEQSFIIFSHSSFSKNLRSELNKSKKYYFWDNGIRNALINNFANLDIRPDKGELWENYLAIERIKKHQYQNFFPNYFFWRTYTQQEIDWIEEKDGKLSAWEFKFQDKNTKTPKNFFETYKVKVKTVNTKNFQSFI